ncbi:MAG: hypothetical protein ACI80H_000083 [Pseudoalteromonas distincta]|jgi:hypothetical protein
MKAEIPKKDPREEESKDKKGKNHFAHKFLILK